jgi:hypothetical protein
VPVPSQEFVLGVMIFPLFLRFFYCILELFQQYGIFSFSFKGDNYRIMELLLKIDDTCINIQNSSGLTPLHLACQLDRRHCVDKLLVSDVIFYVITMGTD